MKKNLTISGSIILSVLLLFSACQKEIKEKPIDPEIQSASKDDHDNDKNECRLVFATNSDITGNFDLHFHYNNKGLADEWNIDNYGLFKQEYDSRGRLKKYTAIINGQVAWFTLVFYKGGDKLEKEVSYDATGTNIIDIAYFTYNAQGKIVKYQSFMNDYLATTKYNREGNVSESELFFGSSPVYSAFWTYKQHFKNPYLAIPGIDHAFPFYTPADFFASKWLYASLKQVAYDEEGNPIVLFEYDPSKTVWQAGPHNYPHKATYFDILSAGWFPYRYEFENCGRGGDNDKNNSQTASPATASGTSRINPMMLLMRNPNKSMKEQVKEFRQKCFNKH